MSENHNIELIINCCAGTETTRGGENNIENNNSIVTFLYENIATGEKTIVGSAEEFVDLMKKYQQEVKNNNNKNNQKLFFHMNLALEDVEGENINKYFDVVIFVLTNALHDGIQEAIRKQQQQEGGGTKAENDQEQQKTSSSTTRTLVHCQAGVSRSATMVAAFIMKYFGIKDSDAVVDFMKTRRPPVDPNPGFMKKLQLFESKI